MPGSDASGGASDGISIVFLLPYAIAFVGVFVALWTAPGAASAATAVVVLLAVTIGAVMCGYSLRSASVLFIVVVPALMLAFLLLPLQSWASGWLAFVCDDAHPILHSLTEQVSRDPTSDVKSTTLIFQACFTADGSDPQVTFIPGVIWSVILLVWLFIALFAGIIAHILRHPEEAERAAAEVAAAQARRR